MLDDIAVWIFIAPLIVFGFGGEAKDALESKKYGTVIWYTSLSITFVRFGALRLATQGGRLSYGQTSPFYQWLGSDLVFALLLVFNLVAFVLHRNQDGIARAWAVLHRKTSAHAQAQAQGVITLTTVPLTVLEETEDEKNLRTLLTNYFDQVARGGTGFNKPVTVPVTSNNNKMPAERTRRITGE